jgi:hypothetical protein
MTIESRRSDINLYLSPEFEDYAERIRWPNPYKQALVAIVQGIRRHPRLQESLEQIAGRFGRKIDLSKRLA